MRIIFFYISLLNLLIISCQSHKESADASSKIEAGLLDTAASEQEVEGKIESLNDSLFNYRSSLKYKDYKLQITTTCQCDSVIPEESNFFNPIVLDQEFVFMYNDSILKKLSLPIRKISQHVYGGKVKEMLDNVIFKVMVMKLTKGDVVYIIEGFGGCNSENCPSFSGMLTMNGEFLSINYRTDKEVIQQKGDTKLLLELTGNNSGKAVLLDELVFYPPANFCQ